MNSQNLTVAGHFFGDCLVRLSSLLCTGWVVIFIYQGDRKAGGHFGE